jgi:hypothetical protein
MDYKLVEKFLTRLRVQRFSENTIENYKSQLIYFLKISNQYKPEDITDNQLEKFIIWLVNVKNIGQSYQKAMLATLKKFLIEKLTCLIFILKEKKIMFDFRLQVFHKVAKRLNFTKAAEELFITQPAVSKHIQEIESFLKTKLFERNGSKVKLTKAGIILFSHTEKIFETYRNLEFEINSLSQNFNGKLRIGASTTIAQYLLPEILASLLAEYFPSMIPKSISFFCSAISICSVLLASKETISWSNFL